MREETSRRAACLRVRSRPAGPGSQGDRDTDAGGGGAEVPQPTPRFIAQPLGHQPATSSPRQPRDPERAPQNRTMGRESRSTCWDLPRPPPLLRGSQPTGLENHTKHFAESLDKEIL